MRDLNTLNETENKTLKLALGRIFRLGARPTQPGDMEQYEKYRQIIMEILDPWTFLNPTKNRI